MIPPSLLQSGLSVHFNGPINQLAINIRFDIATPGITGIKGPSGCGKTSLLRAIAGLHHFPQGYCRLAEEIWQDDTVFLPPWKRPIGYVPQDGGLFSHLSVKKNLLFGMRLIPEKEPFFTEIVDALHLQPLLDRNTHALSGGERQRVAIGRALLTQPRLLLMDEPLSALDLDIKTDILFYIKDFLEKCKIHTLYVSHDAEELRMITTHILDWRSIQNTVLKK
ncbi:MULTISPECIES: ATP-binding cassette domain-containing protein [Acetobacter]|jgi:molybdate transport system ATP-binding protein|uniref:Molybdate transport system ATP-binding protein n=1 Tax=Acetobacter lovaniensis TaxID=104100 RepID=A0A841QE30_9PROT|nr:ATP-binding cassette domain-containing protein [Acetobacter lovaniensis]MBB6456710.1 molybdate transport system ATP-binding protein [Acetobacter lovaniensis]MCP1239296.1 ATP-binding cassette domain-containing protein [Acetobacter lovaniensis]NHN81471.1 ATP-binding cassette domain-containing protein [Acetobacter lovaniensis]GBQ65594.1 molybdenum ABC transporter ATP-binding protein ModC [Acetobacter lovaniensis NRIC 0474]